MESEPLTGCKYNLYPLQQTWIAWSRTGPDVTRSNWANYLCIGNNRRIILYKYLLKQTIISRTIGSHYFLLNIVQFRLSSSYAVQASRIDRHSSNDLVSRRMYFALSIHRTLRRSCHRRQLQMFTVRHLETIIHMNECREQSDDVLHPSTVRWCSPDCWQLHFESGSPRLFSSPSLCIVWSIRTILYSKTSLKSYFTKGDFVT